MSRGGCPSLAHAPLPSTAPPAPRPLPPPSPPPLTYELLPELQEFLHLEGRAVVLGRVHVGAQLGLGLVVKQLQGALGVALRQPGRHACQAGPRRRGGWVGGGGRVSVVRCMHGGCWRWAGAGKAGSAAASSEEAACGDGEGKGATGQVMQLHMHVRASICTRWGVAVTNTHQPPASPTLLPPPPPRAPAQPAHLEELKKLPLAREPHVPLRVLKRIVAERVRPLELPPALHNLQDRRCVCAPARPLPGEQQRRPARRGKKGDETPQRQGPGKPRPPTFDSGKPRAAAPRAGSHLLACSQSVARTTPTWRLKTPGPPPAPLSLWPPSPPPPACAPHPVPRLVDELELAGGGLGAVGQLLQPLSAHLAGVNLGLCEGRAAVVGGGATGVEWGGGRCDGGGRWGGSGEATGLKRGPHAEASCTLGLWVVGHGRAPCSARGGGVRCVAWRGRLGRGTTASRCWHEATIHHTLHVNCTRNAIPLRRTSQRTALPSPAPWSVRQSAQSSACSAPGRPWRSRAAACRRRSPPSSWPSQT